MCNTTSILFFEFEFDRPPDLALNDQVSAGDIGHSNSQEPDYENPKYKDIDFPFRLECA